jgi:hypothetical protein
MSGESLTSGGEDRIGDRKGWNVGKGRGRKTRSKEKQLAPRISLLSTAEASSQLLLSVKVNRGCC